MAANFLELVEISDDTRPVVCVRNTDEIRKVEEKEDCFILEFDPDEELDFSKLSVSTPSDPDLQLLAQKGKVACRDYPHSRHACAKFTFRKMPHENHCKMCYCYVCDCAAPCKKWVEKSRHCDAYDNEKWSIKRKLCREKVERKKVQKQGTVTDKRPDQDATLYVQNLSDTVTKHDLERFFKRAGVVKKSELITLKYTHMSRETGFVTMGTTEEAGRAVAMLDGHRLHGMPINVKRSLPRCPLPISANTYSIYVGNLTRSVDDKRLEEIFRKRGYKIVEARVAVDRVTKESHGYGLVKMRSKSEREDAIKNLNGKMVNGKAIKLFLVRSRT